MSKRIIGATVGTTMNPQRVADKIGHGKDGKSAYELALEKGFEGTLEEWLDSLHGGDGYTPEKGKDYYTEADKAELVNDVLGQIPSGGSGITNTASGESIVLTDSAERKLESLKVYGKSEQFTTIGAQLFNPDNLIRGVAKTKEVSENSYIVTVTGEEAEGSYANYYYSIDVNTVRGKTIYLQADKIVCSSGANGRVRFNVTKPDGTEVQTNIDASNLKKTYVVPDDITKATFAIFSNYGTKGLTETPSITVSGLRFGFTETEWEPYTGGIPSPNPQYRQEITSVCTAGSGMLRLRLVQVEKTLPICQIW